MKDFLIHCIGDSHVSIFSWTNKISDGWPSPNDTFSCCKTYRIGPYLAYNMGDYTHRGYLTAISIIKNIPVGSTLLFSFGEVDCRAHLIRQKEIQNKSIEELVKECVIRYSMFLTSIKDLGYKVIAWGVIPTCNVDEFTIKNPEDYPHYGTYKERNYATNLFNQNLKEYCLYNGLGFLSISDKLVDENLKTLDKEYYLDSVHLSTNALPLILDELEKIEEFL